MNKFDEERRRKEEAIAGYFRLITGLDIVVGGVLIIVGILFIVFLFR